MESGSHVDDNRQESGTLPDEMCLPIHITPTEIRRTHEIADVDECRNVWLVRKRERKQEQVQAQKELASLNLGVNASDDIADDDGLEVVPNNTSVVPKNPGGGVSSDELTWVMEEIEKHYKRLENTLRELAKLETSSIAKHFRETAAKVNSSTSADRKPEFVNSTMGASRADMETPEASGAESDKLCNNVLDELTSNQDFQSYLHHLRLAVLNRGTSLWKKLSRSASRKLQKNAGDDLREGNPPDPGVLCQAQTMGLRLRTKFKLLLRKSIQVEDVHIQVIQNVHAPGKPANAICLKGTWAIRINSTLAWLKTYHHVL